VQSTLNTATREHKEEFDLDRKERSRKLKKLSKKMNRNLQTLEAIEKIMLDEQMDDSFKVHSVKRLLNENESSDFKKLGKTCSCSRTNPTKWKETAIIMIY